MIIKRFANYAASVVSAELPEDARHAAKRAIIDWFSSTIRGGIVPPATMMMDAYADSIGHGNSILYPSGKTSDARTAALINGAASHTIEFDDIFRDGLYHPAAPVISAALALAQAKGKNGDALIRAVIAGYETSNRLAVAVNPAHYEYWHTTGSIGTFGAAAAASAVLGLDGEKTAHAMANAGTLAAGLQQAFRADAMAKPLHPGHAAETGVKLALAAEQGVTGALDILEGARGFGAAMCQGTNENPDWQTAADDLGKSFTIIRITFKNHAACGHTHAAIDGILALRARHNLTPDNVKRIHAASFQKALEICGNQDPQTIFEAKFSLPYVAAMALREGRVRMEAFSDELLKDKELRHLIAKVEVSVDAEIDAQFPKRRAANITIETTDGEMFEHYSPTRKGDPDNPLTDDELAEKFLELTGSVLGDEGAAELLDALWRLDETADLGAIAAVASSQTAAQ